jgi:hypothetical protein
MITKTFPNVPGIDLCKSKGKNVMFEAGINKVQRCSEMWLGFDGAYLNLGRAVFTVRTLACRNVSVISSKSLFCFFVFGILE